MSDTPDTTKVSPEEFRALLKMAGLTVSEDRAPVVMDELNAQLAFAKQLDGVLEDAKEPGFAPYDPTFPKVKLEDEAE